MAQRKESLSMISIVAIVIAAIGLLLAWQANVIAHRAQRSVDYERGRPKLSAQYKVEIPDDPNRHPREYVEVTNHSDMLGYAQIEVVEPENETECISDGFTDQIMGVAPSVTLNDRDWPTGESRQRHLQRPYARKPKGTFDGGTLRLRVICYPAGVTSRQPDVTPWTYLLEVILPPDPSRA